MRITRRVLGVALLLCATGVSHAALGEGTATRVFEGSPPRLLHREGALRVATDPREDIRPTVSLAMDHDAPGVYRFEFTVSNAANAHNAIALFGIADVSEPDSAEAPAQWLAGHGFQEKENALVWAIADTLTPPPPGFMGVNTYPCPYEIQPGESRSGFVFWTSRPPASFSFYVQGSDSLPWNSANYPSLFTTGVTGTMTVTGVGDEGETRRGPRKDHPWPNPSRNSVSVAFTLPAPADLNVSVFDIAGRKVREVASGRKGAGLHVIVWDGIQDDGKPAAPGVYFARLVVGGRRVGQEKITILR